jgi:hypothetical protein
LGTVTVGFVFSAVVLDSVEPAVVSAVDSPELDEESLPPPHPAMAKTATSALIGMRRPTIR